MNAHNPFDAKKDWSNPYCQNSSNDPMVDALLGNAYHVVRTVYCNLGNLKLLYDFLNQYGMVLGVQSEAELKALTTDAKYARIYGFSRAGDRQVTDYLYVEGDRTGILPNDTTATGSWITVATSGSNGGDGTSSSGGAYIPWVYSNGSATGGETTINVPDGTVGVPFIIVNGDMQYVGRGFEFNIDNLSVTLAQSLEEGDEVVFLLTGVPAVPDNPHVNDWVQINWLYNNGAAVGGEQVLAIPYTFQSIPAVYKNGLRLYKGLTTESYTADPDNQRIILTEPLATNDRLIVQIGGEAQVLESSDHTIQEVARAANVKDFEVILSTDTTQVLNGKTIVYDVSSQHIYGLPTLPPNVYISSVSGSQLTYSPGNVTVDLLPLPSEALDKVNLLKANLSSTEGTSLIGLPTQGTLKEVLFWATPEQFGAVGDGVTDDTAAVTAAIMTGHCVFKRGATYRLVMTEANVITPPAGAIIDFNGAKITHETMGFLVFLNKNPDVTILRFNGVYKGSYPTTVTPTTRYGISRPHEAAFCGFIGMHTSASRFKLINAMAVGASATNRYDFLVSGYEGNFQGSLFSNIYCTHYACVLINNFANCNIEYVYGTLRHDDSFPIYGPSHLMYINNTRGSITNCGEFGSLLSNIHGGCNATLQLTESTGCVVDGLVCTMDDTPLFATKVSGTGGIYKNMVSRSKFTTENPSGPIHLVQFITNSQANLFDLVLEGFRLYLPANVGGVCAFLCGGTRTKVRDMEIDIPSPTVARTVEPLMFVTCDQPDVEITLRNSVAGVPVLLSSCNNGKIALRCINNGVAIKSNASIWPSWTGWGESVGTSITVEHVNGSTSTSTYQVNAGTKDRCVFTVVSPDGNIGWYAQWFGSSADPVSLTTQVPVPHTSINTGILPMYFYRVEVSITTTNGAGGAFSEYIVMMRAGATISTLSKQMHIQQFNDTSVYPITVSADASGVITATTTRPAGGENIRNMYIRVRRVNTPLI